MDRSILRRWLIALAAMGLLLPVAICILLALAALLQALGDTGGGAVVSRLALAGGVVWVFGLVALVLLQALALLSAPGRGDSEAGED